MNRETPSRADSPSTEDKTQTETSSGQTPIHPSGSSQYSIQAISSSVDISKFPDVAVEVEPRASFDKEAYRHFPSATSTQQSQRTNQPESNSRFEDSSSQVESPAPRRTETETIVPDSQSLPQSSSYVPSQSISIEPLEAAQRRSSAAPQESLTGIVIPASQETNPGFLRRGSEPVTNKSTWGNAIADYRSTFAPPRSSDLDTSVEASESRPFVPRRRSNHRVIIDSPTPSPSLVPEHQPELPLESIEPLEEATQQQEPGTHSQHSSEEQEDIESSEHSTAFVTQVPLQLDGQSSPTYSESLAEPTRTPAESSRNTSEAWEAGQIYPRLSNSASLISSGIRTPTQLQSAIPKEAVNNDYHPSINRQSDLVEASQVQDFGESHPVARGLGLELQSHSDILPRPITEAGTGQSAPQTRNPANTFVSSEVQVDQFPGSLNGRVPQEPQVVHTVQSPFTTPRLQSPFTTPRPGRNPIEVLNSSEVQINRASESRESRLPPQPLTVHAVEGQFTSPRLPRNSVDSLRSSEIQQRLPSSIDSRVPPDPPTRSDVNMSEANSANDEIMAEAVAEVAAEAIATATRQHERQKSHEGRNGKDTTLAPPPAEEITMDFLDAALNKAHRSAATRKAELEVKTRPEIAGALQSPKGLKSPSLARFAMTPKGPLSPNAVGSPLSMQMASPRSTRSPSKIPEREPYRYQEEPSFIGVDPTQAVKDVPLTVVTPWDSEGAFPKVEDHQTDEAGTIQQISTPEPSLKIQNLGPREFVMPLSMPPRAQKEYIDQYRKYVERIYAFDEDHDVSRETLEELNHLLDRLSKVTTHVDLEGGGPDSQDEVDTVREADYAASVSAKFSFLDNVLAFARDDRIHIVIAARHGQISDFIETTLKARKVNYLRLIQLNGREEVLRSNFEFGSNLKISLVATDMEHSAYLHWAEKADLVIAFDETFSANRPWLKVLRSSKPGRILLAPVIRLVVYSSLEHINLCISLNLDPNERLRRLLNHLLEAEPSLGQLASGNVRDSPFNVKDCAEQLVKFVSTGGDQKSLDIPEMPRMEGIPVRETDISPSDERSESSELLKLDDSIQYWPYLVAQKPQEVRRKPGEKREKRPLVRFPSSVAYLFPHLHVPSALYIALAAISISIGK